MKRLAFLLLTILMVCACGGPSKPAPQKHPKIVPGPKIAVVAHHPKIAGVDPTVGQVLNTTNGTWTNSPTSFAYQWQRCSPSCANISAATSSSYTVVSADLGDTIDVIVTASNAAGSASQTSAQTATVTGGAAPVNTATPVVSGVPTVGTSLSVSTGSWTVGGVSASCGGTITCTYQWQDCDGVGAGCTDIGGATSSSYTVTGSDAQSSLNAIVTATNGSGSTPASYVTGPGPVQFMRVNYGVETCPSSGACSAGSSLTTAQEAGSYQVMDLQHGSFTAATVTNLHAANPNLKILAYLEETRPVSSDTAGDRLCDTWANVDANETWFLHTATPVSSGNRLSSGGTNIGNPGTASYRTACANRVQSWHTALGTDGVFWDDINVPQQYGGGGIEYPSNNTTDFGPALEGFMNVVTPAIRAWGGLSISNIAGASAETYVFPAWLSNSNNYSDGVMQESWMDGGSGTAQQNSFNAAKFNDAAQAAANGKHFLMLVQNSTEAAQTYGLAAGLLFSQGLAEIGTNWSSSSTECLSGAACETFLGGERNTALQLGPGTGSTSTACTTTASQCTRPTLGGVSVYKRTFAHGIVLVNPSTSTTTSFALGGTFSGYNVAPCTSGSTCTTQQSPPACTSNVCTVTSATTLTLYPDGAAILLGG